MLYKLAIQNVKKSSKDYLIYFVTIILSFAFIYAFNALVFSSDIQSLSKDMVNFKYAIIFVSVVVVFVVGYLIYYMSRFMLEKRSKEFGIYLLLGIENRKVANLFFIENTILGCAGLLGSFLVGTLLYQMMLSIIVRIFTLPFQIHITLSLEAIGLTLIYFFAILLFSLIKCRKKVRKMKIYDLLYMDKKNENVFLKTKNSKKYLFFFSLLCGCISQYMLYRLFTGNTDVFNMGLFIICLTLMIVCLYTFSVSVSSFITEILLKNKKIKYCGENLFLLRHFSSKMNTMGFTLGTLSLLFFFTFVGLNVGFLMKGIFDEQIETSAPYDVSIYLPGMDDDFDKYTQLTKKKYTIEEKLIYQNYADGSHQIKDLLTEDALGYHDMDGFIRLKDYNKLLSMLGEEPISLKKDQFYLHTFPKYASILGKKKHIVVGDKDLYLKGISSRKYTSNWFPGCSYIIVVPDAYVNNMEVINTVLSINTKEETTEAFAEELTRLNDPTVYTSKDGISTQIYSAANITVRGMVIAEQKSMMIMIGFSLFYVAFIFIATAATILSIQQLSDATKYKFRYRILSQLGVAEKEMNVLILKQLLTYFCFPLVLPTIMSILATLSVHRIFAPVMQHPWFVWLYILISLSFFFLLYLLYFILTYVSFRKNVRES